MTKKNDEQAMMLLVDELFDELLKTSDEELLREASEDDRGNDVSLDRIRAEIETAINSLAKDRLAEARTAVARLTNDRLASSVDPVEAGKRLAEFLSSDTGRSRMTIAARNGQGSSENDILSAFSDLCELQEFKHSVGIKDFGSSPKAERILQDLGISEPQEIDVEAIAWALGARIRYDYLDQCEARIVGTNDSAIITVDKKASIQRQRFSICHELGHWIYHRRRMLVCQANEIELPSEGNSLERVADRFASELLMPNYLFVPIAQNLGRPSMQVVRKLANTFNTSLTATAIRLVEINQLPIVLVNHGKAGRRWHTRSQSVASGWFPNNELGHGSSAFNMIFGTSISAMPPRSVNASVWFGRRDASLFEVVEEAVRVDANEVLTLLSFKNASEFLQHSRQT